MFGVVNGCYSCKYNQVDENNERIADRNIPSASLRPQYSIRPVSTKYSLLPILDQRQKVNVPLHDYQNFNVNTIFNPGNAQAPWAGFANNVNTESTLRNQFFALQKCEQSEYVPSSNSDLYQTQIDYRPVKQTHPLLFERQDFEQFNPNVHNLGGDFFNNSTRNQLKNIN
tara:strand:- start:392 stop:901 length:510 start_codon:yes stop_codon:yes gene_type:complete